MTEQEARILASELARHKTWRVLTIFKTIWPGDDWAVFLRHRTRSEWMAIRDSDPKDIRKALDGDADIHLRYSIDFQLTERP